MTVNVNVLTGTHSAQKVINKFLSETSSRCFSNPTRAERLEQCHWRVTTVNGLLLGTTDEEFANKEKDSNEYDFRNAAVLPKGTSEVQAED